jgi:hypothetical protein
MSALALLDKMIVADHCSESLAREGNSTATGAVQRYLLPPAMTRVAEVLDLARWCQARITLCEPTSWVGHQGTIDHAREKIAMETNCNLRLRIRDAYTHCGPRLHDTASVPYRSSLVK